MVRHSTVALRIKPAWLDETTIFLVRLYLLLAYD